MCLRQTNKYCVKIDYNKHASHRRYLFGKIDPTNWYHVPYTKCNSCPNFISFPSGKYYMSRNIISSRITPGPGETPTKFIIIPLLRAQSLHRNNSEAVEEKTREGVKRRSTDTPQELVDLRAKN